MFTKRLSSPSLLGIVLFTLLALIILVGVIACGPKPTELPKEIQLPFDTIERNDNLSAEEGYSGQEPRVIFITTRQAIDRLKGLVTQETIDRLAELNFQQYFVLAVFRGRQATFGYDTIIERVARRGNKIVIYAQFWEPSPYYVVQAAETSPYHVIKVRRDDGVLQETELVLQSRLITPTPPSQ